MKKINYLIIGIILLATANAFSQSSYLFTFSGKDKVTSVAVPLDSIYIKNETTGEDTTITDTFVMLTLSSGINEKGWYDNTFSIYQNFENVNGVQSSFKVNLPNNSNLIITVYDIAGKAVSNYG